MDRRKNSRVIKSIIALLLTAGGVSSAQNMALGNYDNVPSIPEASFDRPINSIEDINGLPVVKSSEFAINYQLDPETLKYISKIELWCGRGKTGPWQLYDYDLDRTPPVNFRVASEGVWRFLIVPVDINGVRYYQGQDYSQGNLAVIPASVPAQTTLFIDYTPPQIYMHDPVLQNTGNVKQVIIQWNVFDSFIGDSPVDLYWIETGKDKWQLAQQSLKAFDSLKWQVPQGITNPICFKLVCKDKAGNIEEKVSNIIDVYNGSTISPTAQYSNETYVLGNSSQNNASGIPSYPEGSPLVSTDMTDSGQGQNKLSTESFIPDKVEVMPAGKSNNPVINTEQDNGQNNLQQYQQSYTVQPAINEITGGGSEVKNQRATVEKLIGRAADYMELGFESYDRGEYERARMLFEQVIAMEPDYIPTYYHLADVLYIQGKFEQAKANFDIFLSLKPGHRKALLGLMYCHLKLGNLDQARDILNNKLNQTSDSKAWDDLFIN